MFDIVVQNLLSPVVLFFILGLIGAIVKSDFKFPPGLSEALSIYLLIAIGLKGGMELSNYSFSEVALPIAATLFLGSIIPVITMVILKWMMKLDLKNSIGLAATYGSVSIVTYGAALTFLDNTNTSYEAFMNGLVVVMEIPAIFVALMLLAILEGKKVEELPNTKSVGISATSLSSVISPEVIRESLFGKSVFLLVGSLLTGLIVGKEAAMPVVQPLFIDLYQSMLLLFLLNMGLIAGQRLAVVRRHGIKLLLFGILTPVLYGILGIFVGYGVGLSLGGATLLGILSGSASYIAAPAALRASVPDADPSIYLGLALGVTFPFNLAVNIPLLYAIASLLY
ncbi:sodium-dependent bicarbonate transport family permease [Alkalihalobacillus sp. LMS39]|uniref:sodium-dependent bicarbonate transport family permease n=1 Tax=Alkalihalobacillus sp. LMS39 TaxID=2924032 RepID=UPI001FB4271E|nr:sodium-dependent bicarbonate transport family permease [Alkalihalobacillus sp. LMS39]UOE93168.1 sodium-dependent bicarbonate transport family permease [Alkalihalobacillus sp. LMS39]